MFLIHWDEIHQDIPVLAGVEMVRNQSKVSEYSLTLADPLFPPGTMMHVSLVTFRIQTSGRCVFAIPL